MAGHHGSAGHGHSHDHSHEPRDFGRAFALGIGLNVFFVAVEAGYGFAANSMALLADAGHNLSDVLGLVIAWIAYGLARLRPTARFTYGLRGSSILAALFNAIFLLLAVGAIAVSAFERLSDPQPVAGRTMIIVAAIGIAINGFTAWLFARGRGDLNLRGAYLHMMADAGVSAGVVVAGVAIGLTGWLWIDPVVSLAIVLVIVWGTWGLLKDSLTLSLAAVPPGIDPNSVQSMLAALPGVTHVHDLHIWAMSTSETALTAHLVIPGGHPGDRFLHDAAHALDHQFHIAHATLQIETGDGDPCALSPVDRV